MTHHRFNLAANPIGVHRWSSVTPLPAARRPRGNVLILVVVLLVLLALAGTAYLSVVRVDRTSTVAGSEITQAEMLLDSMQSLVEQRLINDLTGNDRWDHPNSDAWLGDRVPTWIGDAATGFPVWRFASDIAEQSGLAYRFDSPFAPGFPLVSGPKRNYRLQPGMDPATGMPAIAILDGSGNDLGFGLQPAADADGDGIADAPYFQLPGRVGDITYYAGVRVIDNTAAINVNTAFDRDFDYAPGDYLNLRRNYGMFTSNIGLRQLLTDYNPATGTGGNEATNANRFRFGYAEGANAYLDPADSLPRMDMRVDQGMTSSVARPADDLYFDTQGEALWTQVGRRVDNPGYLTADRRFQSYPISEMMGLAYRFGLKDTSGQVRTLLEANNGWGIPASTVSTDVQTGPYDADQVRDWFVNAFDYEGDAGATSRRTVRQLLVTHNPVGNIAPIHRDSDTSNIPWSIFNFDNTLAYPTIGGPAGPAQAIARTSINSATFGELWRAFWAVMHRNSVTPDPDAQVPPEGILRMFRSEHTAGFTGATPLTPYEMLQLRAAIAAVNAEDLRDYDEIVTERIITIGTAPNEKEISIFGTEKQPFITEVIVHLGGLEGPDDDYIAIELYNPYYNPGSSPSIPATPDDALNLENWHLAGYDRATGTFVHLHSFTDTDKIAPRGFLTIESPGVRDTLGNPIPDPPAPVVVADLRPAIGMELVLLRPRRTGDVIAPEVASPTTTDELKHFIPADQVDLSAMDTEAAATDPVLGDRWYYARVAPAGVAAVSPNQAWRCVYPYPGPLNVISTSPTDRGFLNDEPAEVGTFGAPNTVQTFDTALEFTIPLNDYGWPGPRPTPVAPNLASPQQRASFPYGGFARNGDILMTPFIGAYVVREVGANIREGAVLAMNSVTLDAAYAEREPGTVADEGQHVGRFSPLRHEPGVVDWADGYEWTRRIFDHLTAHQNPDGDYLPNISPESYVLGQAPSTTDIPNSPLMPQPTPNGPVSTVASANQGNERGVGTHGLININTAPLQVLNMLPLTASMDVGTPDRVTNELTNRAIAEAIWLDRQANGPFETPFDILRVVEVRTYGAAVDPASSDLTEAHGDVTPYETAAPAGDGVLDDFEQHYMPLTRLSNLITTRSDSYTVYIVLEGWRNAGTPDATRVSQRRRAFIVDRSGYTQTNPRLGITPVPMD